MFHFHKNIFCLNDLKKKVIYGKVYSLKIGPIFVSSTLSFHSKKFQSSFESVHLQPKIYLVFIPNLKLHNQYYHNPNFASKFSIPFELEKVKKYPSTKKSA